MQTKGIKVCWRCLVSLLVFSFFISGCAHGNLSRKDVKEIRKSSYMKGYIHGQSTCQGTVGRQEYEDFQDQLQELR